ncbi:hypothetical protein AM10699_19530 [Acaryochloris marina MBIC10699]|nr:hypothetical protein AM10699_19530 [Acaryochloris marina MBIC10699]
MATKGVATTGSILRATTEAAILATLAIMGTIAIVAISVVEAVTVAAVVEIGKSSSLSAQCSH